MFDHTTNSILSDSILYSERPFNANISLKTFSIQVDEVHQQQISTTFSLGIMGIAALCFEIQDKIHKWLKNPRPQGWLYQTKNGIIINYQLNYEKQLLQAGNNFLLNTTAQARIGTLNNKLSGGFNLMAGRFNNRFRPVTYEKRKAAFYFYAQGSVNFIGYDASIQGGLFTRNKPNVIACSDVNRVTFQADAGVIVHFKRLYLSYTQSFLTKKFKGGSYHRKGGVSIGFAL